jgi:hypothetical protein
VLALKVRLQLALLRELDAQLRTARPTHMVRSRMSIHHVF